MRFFILGLLIFTTSIMPVKAEDGFMSNLEAPCDSLNQKEFMAGKYVIIGQRDTKGKLPTKEDLYTARAILTMDHCTLNVTRCDGDKVVKGTIEQMHYMEAPGWGVMVGKEKEPRWFYEKKENFDNYAILYGSGEFWRPDTEENEWTCQ